MRTNPQAMNPYEILGLNPGPVTPESVEKAHRAARKDAHPDREGGSEEKMSAINQARDILLNPERKKRFDEMGSTLTGPPSLEELAFNIISNIFEAALEQAPSDTPWHTILGVIVKELAKGLDKAEECKKHLPSRIKKAKKILSKIDCDPILRSILTRSIERMEANINAVNNQIALGEMMIKLMQSIKFK